MSFSLHYLQYITYKIQYIEFYQLYNSTYCVLTQNLENKNRAISRSVTYFYFVLKCKPLSSLHLIIIS